MCIRDSTSTLLAEAVANNKPLVIGTTGHTELERQEIVDAAASLSLIHIWPEKVKAL